jgi:hypothetical protein
MLYCQGKIFRILLLTCSLCASGCNVFTPPVERRIERNQSTFDAYPPEVRENLRLGQIQLGYDKEMVSISLGQPDRRYLRLDSEGKVVIWVYLGKEVRSRHHRTTLDLPMFDHNGNRITRREELELDLDDHQEFDRRRIHFVEDKVVALEQTMD